jgi:hydrogenase maturation factor
VDDDGVPTWVTAAGLVDRQVDGYVVVYAGQPLEKMDNAQAEEMRAWYADLESMLADADGARSVTP